MSAVMSERVRSDVEVLSRAGLGLEEFLVEAGESVRRAVPWVGACIGTHDPATRILSGARKYGDLLGQNEQDVLFASIEYTSDEATTVRRLHAAGRTSVAMRQETGGEIERSIRMSRLMKPYYGYHDEARLVFAEGESFWGAMSIFRGPDDAAFSEEEIAFLGSLSGAFARGVRTGILAQLTDRGPIATSGPAVIVFDAQDRLAQLTPGAQARLDQLSGVPHAGDPMSIIASLVGSARRFARGEIDTPPRVRVRTADGSWLVAHASPLAGADGDAGNVVITIEEARPPEIVDLVVAAFELTGREREITRMVIQGADTKEIARALFLSPYTVQDHLKSIFDKAGVRSRRELVARVYFDQYAPRMGQPVGPSGAFAEL